MNIITPDFSSRRIGEASRAGIAGTIEFAAGDCDLGKVLVARSPAGICAIMLGSDDEELEQKLATTFPDNIRVSNEPALRNDLAAVATFIASPCRELDLTLDIRGTPFQRRVWDALRSIPVGTSLTYAQLARRIGGPKSLRAIAQACAENPIALAVPCHRVMGHSGSMAVSSLGAERRRFLINREIGAVS